MANLYYIRLFRAVTTITIMLYFVCFFIRSLTQAHATNILPYANIRFYWNYDAER